ncbi:MAG: PIN domain-containing protein [Chloroflexi bacterium]|nr:PIN domain-containing protein [Chloroflexota bacterium]MDA1272403.1 PIN domain-containing protein [Chloroflexota bacterium]
MAKFLDASVVLRYLTGISPEEAAIAGAIIDQQDDLMVSGVVLNEVAYVLKSVYRLPREDIVDSLIGFIQKDNIDTYGLDERYAIQGLMMCRPSGRVSYADALIWATARSDDGNSVLYSFDRRFPNDVIEVRTGP